jgi:TRAP transporter TAXI family solute receptor
MMLHHYLATLAVCCVVASAAMPLPAAGEEPFGITTGEPRGTYFAVAQDISEMAGSAGLELRVLPSQGSLENLYRVFTATEAQLGIVQHDVLFWVRSNEGSDTAQRMAERIKLVFPLYDEEVHVLARNDAGIESFADLAGKIVATGPSGSGTSVTAGVLFTLAGIEPAERVELGAAEALAQLKRSALDAMIYVAGAPVKLLVDDIQASDNLHLVPIEDAAVASIYGAPVRLDASHYPWAKDGVRTFGVKAVLVTYDYQSNREKCAYVGDIASLVRAEIGALREVGHLKWRDVDLDAEVIGWDVAPCSATAGKARPGHSDPDFQRFLEEMTRSRG